LKLLPVENDNTVRLVNSSAKFILHFGSCEAEINGVSVWLSYPVLLRDGAPFVSKLDIQTTLKPLLSPPKNPPGALLKSICLDAGHGGKDPGYLVGPNQEKKYTLLLAQDVGERLIHAGLTVSMTRSGDTFVELPVRPDIAKQRNADVFLSLHFNSAETSRSTVRGAEVYCLTPAGANSTNSRGEGANAGWCAGNRYNNQNVLLAFEVQQALVRNSQVESSVGGKGAEGLKGSLGLNIKDRGIRRARYAVLRDATMPAVLVEAGFMSHPEEGKKILDRGYRRQMARAIVDGLLAYKQLVEKGT
jgi:N-acetylmuramoyl-L-alanine amidase